MPVSRPCPPLDRSSTGVVAATLMWMVCVPPKPGHNRNQGECKQPECGNRRGADVFRSDLADGRSNDLDRWKEFAVECLGGIGHFAWRSKLLVALPHHHRLDELADGFAHRGDVIGKGGEH